MLHQHDECGRAFLETRCVPVASLRASVHALSMTETSGLGQEILGAKGTSEHIFGGGTHPAIEHGCVD